MTSLYTNDVEQRCDRARVSTRGISPFVRAALFVCAFVAATLAGSAFGSALTPTAASALLRGIDVASWQHPGTPSDNSRCGRPIDWGQVRDSGISFAYVKSTQATTYTNVCFAQDWAGIESAGLLRGSYHYAKPALPISTAVDQARYFVSRAGSMTGPLDLPGMLDLEETGGLNATDLSNWTRAFLNEVTVLTGKKPVLYMGAYFFPGTIAPDISASYRLWIPSYPCQDFGGNRICDPYTYRSQPRLPSGWSAWTWWQFSSIEQVAGIYANSFNGDLGDVDMNWFCCDFGSLQALTGGGGAGGSPFGKLDSVSVTDPTQASVSGWAIDPDTREPITVHVYVDGQGYAVAANGASPALAEAYPGFGGNHAFSTIVPLPLGALRVCAYGINVASGVNSFLGCLSLGGEPYGVVDSARSVGPGLLEVAGWAIDPNGVNPTQIRVSVDGVDSVVRADQNRPDLGNPGGLGSVHGYSAVIQLPSGGTRRACVTALNSIGPGGEKFLGCQSATLPGGSPIGVVDSAVGNPGSISLSGWALDPDTPVSLDVHVYVDGVGTALRADQTRDDVSALFPGYGSARGFRGSVAARSGSRTVCAYGINIGVGTNSLLGCRVVQVPGGAAFGALDSVTYEDGSIRVAGWAIDPDTSAPVPIHVYVQGQGYALNADRSRPDLAAVFPAYGAAHGFSGLVPAPEGNQSVCAYAIDVVGGDGNRLLGCRSVTVPMGSPIGYIDGAVVTGGTVFLSGWAIDPNTSAADIVHVYVNGFGFAINAGIDRPDLGNPWGLGSAHGWQFSTPRIGDGVQRVCVYALNIVGPGSHKLLGCRELS